MAHRPCKARGQCGNERQVNSIYCLSHGRLCEGLGGDARHCKKDRQRDSIYCTSHQRFCRAFVKDGSRRCKNDREAESQYCSVHPNEGSRCAGWLNDDSRRCLARKLPGAQYCCTSHDPSIPSYSLDWFRENDVRTRFLENADIIAIHDAYDGQPLPDRIDSEFEVDHKVEIQALVHVFQRMTFDEPDQAEHLATGLCRDLVNRTSNLAITKKVTNRVKGNGFRQFLAYRTYGQLHEHDSLSSFILDANFEGKKITRDTTKEISRQLRHAFRRLANQLDDEGDDPLTSIMQTEVHQLAVDGQLYQGCVVWVEQ